MGKVEQEKRSHAIFWGMSQYPYAICHAARGLRIEQGQEAGENGTAPPVCHRTGSVESILRMLQEHMMNGGGLSGSSSASSSGGGASPSPSMQLQVVDLGQEGPQLKRLDFVRAQGGFWLTWMSTAYSSGRSLVPLPGSLIEVLEGKVQPLVEAMSEQSEKALFALDATVDSVVSGLLDSVPDALLKLAAMPPVNAVVRTATPTAEALYERYQAAHDAVVATPIYLRVSERAVDTLHKVHESRLYKIFLPLVSPLTEPAVKRIMASSTYQAVKEHLTPTAAHEALTA